MLVSNQDFAKYPFTKEASEHVKSLDLRIEELDAPEYGQILDRAEERLEQALMAGIVSPTSYVSPEEEILSFPVAMVLVSSIADNYLRRRYALAEAKRIDLLLGEENEGKLLDIAKTSLGWRVGRRPYKGGKTSVLTISFIDYLRNAVGFHDDYWKLVNRRMSEGQVILEKIELARLVSEEVRTKIEKDLEKSPTMNLTDVAPKLASRLEGIKQILAQRKESLRREEIPKNIMASAYPPCIRKLYDNLLAGQHVPHMGRFTLTSFLLNVGMPAEELVKLYISVSDFSESLTRYQVEHIAGQKGSGTKYTPPTCDSLKTHNLCPGPDELCHRIRHPLSYYSIEAESLLRAGKE
ncbi:DNA primase large subunit PriL [Candidatus Bathyarchaeota archaeon]|nr:DNA primase large subunit PriL [Candidatus Bathyarchaeota archaeon]